MQMAKQTRILVPIHISEPIPKPNPIPIALPGSIPVDQSGIDLR